MGEIYFPVSIAGLDEYLYCMETLISADPSKIPLLGDILVIAGTVCYVQAPNLITCYTVSAKNEEGKKYTGVKRTFHISLMVLWSITSV